MERYLQTFNLDSITTIKAKHDERPKDIQVMYQELSRQSDVITVLQWVIFYKIDETHITEKTGITDD